MLALDFTKDPFARTELKVRLILLNQIYLQTEGNLKTPPIKRKKNQMSVTQGYL